MSAAGDRAWWQSRARSFGSVAAQYAALRPSYPADAVAFLVGERPRRVLDLGAGTGLLAEVLVHLGHEVVAVDPSPEMLAELTGRLAGVPTGVGTAESIPLPDGDVDAVVAGQAAHWFDPEPAAAELRRVLRPGGVVGLIWNERDRRVPWVAALDAVIADSQRDLEGDDRAAQAMARALATADVRFESRIVQRVSPERVVAGIGTRSYVATLDEPDRAAFLDRVRALLAEHPDTRGRDLLELPYVTVAHRLTLG